MSEIIDYNSKIDKLEKMESDLKERIYQLKERKKQQDAVSHDVGTNIKLTCSHKYASLYTSQYHFYYGCEHTHCPVHGIDAHCGCQDEDWAFTVHDTAGKLRFCRPERLLAPITPSNYNDGMSPFVTKLPSAMLHLLHGIGQYFNYTNSEYVLRIHEPAIVELVVKKMFSNMRQYMQPQLSDVPERPGENALRPMVPVADVLKLISDGETAVMEALGHLIAVHE